MSVGSVGEPVATAAARTLVGRVHELAELLAGLTDAYAGRGRCFLLTGDAGIGKTRLAQEVADTGQPWGLLSVWGRCWEGGGAPAFWPWRQLLRGCVQPPELQAFTAHLGTAQSLVTPSSAAGGGPQGAVDGEPARFRLFEDVTAFLKAVSDQQPLVLLVDDLHSADQDSLLLLRFVARTLRGLRILLIGTYREGDVRHNPALGELLGDLGRESTTLPLRGLGEVELAALARQTLAEMHSPSAQESPPAELIHTLHRITEGNPFFAREIVRALAVERAGRLPTAAASVTLPEQVREAIRRRIRPLSLPATAVLSIAAVIGRDFDTQVLERVAAASAAAPSSWPGLDEAVAAGLIAPLAGQPQRFSFSHALIRETLYDDLPPGRRAGMHHAVGVAMEELYGDQADAPVAAIAHHYVRALPGGDVERAVRAAQRAAERATALLAYEDAIGHWDDALHAFDSQAESVGAVPDGRRRRCELLLNLGAALNAAASRERAREVFHRAAETARAIAAPELFARAVLGMGGEWFGAAEVPKVDAAPGAVLDDSLAGYLKESLDLLGRNDSPWRARLLVRLAVEQYFTASLEEREALANEALAIARRLNDPATLAQVLCDANIAIGGPHNVRERLAMAREVTRIAQALGHIALEHIGRAVSVSCAVELGDPDVLQAEARPFVRQAEQNTLPIMLWPVKVYEAMLALLRGRFAAAEVLAREARALGRRAQRPALMPYSLQLVALRREQGRLADVAETIGIIKAVADQYPNLPHLRAQLACLYCQQGRTDQARAEFEQAAARDFADLPLNNTWMMALSELAEACVCLGDRARAERLYALLQPYARHASLSPMNAVCWGSVSRSLGVLASLLERWDAAEQHFKLALERNAALAATPWVAYTQFNYATMRLARAAPGDADAARALLQEALTTAQALGMKALEEKVSGAWSLVSGSPSAPQAAVSDQQPETRDRQPETNLFRKQGEYWTIAYGGETFRLKDARGLSYIAHLLRHPGQEFHAFDLVISVGEPGAEVGNRKLRTGDPGPLLDAQAKAAYKQRLDELREELEEAEGFNDSGRAERAREEIELITQELARAVGLGGRDRHAGSDAERARVNVTRAIAGALKRVAEHHKGLAEHLRRTVRTGTFCVYAPDPRLPIQWQV